jgi:hypothetical protein
VSFFFFLTEGMHVSFLGKSDDARTSTHDIHF